MSLPSPRGLCIRAQELSASNVMGKHVCPGAVLTEGLRPAVYRIETIVTPPAGC
jgi:hypothetical protein